MYNPCIIVGILRLYNLQIVVKHANSNKCSIIVRSILAYPLKETLAKTLSGLKLNSWDTRKGIGIVPMEIGPDTSWWYHWWGV